MSVNEALYFTFRPSIVNVDDRYVVPLQPVDKQQKKGGGEERGPDSCDNATNAQEGTKEQN